MFDLGWMELLVIGVVALIVVGPKDLPVMFKTVGNFVGKAKRMAREFQSTMNAAASETGLNETVDIIKKIDSVKNPKVFMKNTVERSIEPDEANSKKKQKKESGSKNQKEELKSL